MFPILPILILLLMGPANAERLAVEGRLPPALLAMHRAMAVPACAVVVALVEENVEASPVLRTDERPLVARPTFPSPRPIVREVAAPGWPTRAGPWAA